jgi:hypothetical protein
MVKSETNRRCLPSQASQMTFFCSASFLKVPLYMSYEKRIYKIVGTFQKLYGTEYFNAKTNIMTCLSLCGSATSFTLRRFGAQIN